MPQKSVILNSTNIVPGTGNSKLRANFTGTFKVGNDKTQVGLASFSFYSSIFNITSAIGNNVVSIKWVDNITYTLTFEDGYYDIATINYRIQSFCIANNLYVVNSTGSYVYFVEFLLNATRYAVNLNLYVVPTSSVATTLGYTKPSGSSWSFPTTATTPQITFGTPFGLLIGYTAQTLPATVQTTNQSYLSSLSPEINPTNSIIMTCNLIHDKYTNPPNVLYSMPITSSIGNINAVQIGSVVYNSVSQNSYSYVEINLLDQKYNPITLQDNEIIIQLSLIEPDKQ